MPPSPEACYGCPTTSGAFSLEDAVTRDEIIAVIQKLSKKRGRTIQLTELVRIHEDQPARDPNAFWQLYRNPARLRP